MGLVAGSLPGIAKMFHFFDDRSSSKPWQPLERDAWAANQTIGGTPLTRGESPAASRYHSEELAVLRPTCAKPSVGKRIMMGGWSIGPLKT